MKIYDKTNAISKVQIEVWETREKIMEETKGLTIEESIEYIAKRAKKAGDEYRKMIEENLKAGKKILIL